MSLGAPSLIKQIRSIQKLRDVFFPLIGNVFARDSFIRLRKQKVWLNIRTYGRAYRCICIRRLPCLVWVHRPSTLCTMVSSSRGSYRQWSPTLIRIIELILTSKQYASILTAVEPQWLAEVGAVFFSVRHQHFSDRQKQLISKDFNRQSELEAEMAKDAAQAEEERLERMRAEKSLAATPRVATSKPFSSSSCLSSQICLTRSLFCPEQSALRHLVAHIVGWVSES